ncbi:MAG: response regulator transcription factor [Candidatus Sericytochromatia bacterium]|nr:response regulator transcription factor [Candidatus Sericytochromatia bacterium]
MREILLVEDDPEISKALTEILGDYGYPVVWHADGQDGLAWLQQAVELPPVILLDLQLPRMNGWDFVDVLRLDERLNRIPIIVMSAKREMPPPNIVAFLPKPIQLDRLFKALDQYCPPVA